MPHRKVARVLWANLAVIVLVGSAIANSILFSQTRSLAKDARSQARQSRHLARENRQRIAEQQQSRIASCRQTYESFNEVFKPFFPPPKKRTQEQRDNLQKLSDRVDELKKNCSVQTRPR